MKDKKTCFTCALGVVAYDEKGEYLFCYKNNKHYKNADRKACSEYKAQEGSNFTGL